MSQQDSREIATQIEKKWVNGIGVWVHKAEIRNALIDSITEAIERRDNIVREDVAEWMIAHSFTTGHGDTLAHLLAECGPQVDALRVENDRLTFERDALLGKPDAVHLGAQAAIIALRQTRDDREHLVECLRALAEAKRVINHFGDVLNGMDCVDAVEEDTGVSNAWVDSVYHKSRAILSADWAQRALALATTPPVSTSAVSGRSPERSEP
jgi:hypothetical protein